MKVLARRLRRHGRSHPFIIGAVAATAAFFAGLVVGGNPSGTLAEWLAGIGTVAAVAVALGIASQSTRDLRHQWRLDQALRFLQVVEKDRREADADDTEARSPEGVALAAVLRPIGLGQMASWYYTDPDEMRRKRQTVGDGSPVISTPQIWGQIREDALGVVERLALK